MKVTPVSKIAKMLNSGNIKLRRKVCIPPNELNYLLVMK